MQTSLMWSIMYNIIDLGLILTISSRHSQRYIPVHTRRVVGSTWCPCLVPRVLIGAPCPFLYIPPPYAPCDHALLGARACRVLIGAPCNHDAVPISHALSLLPNRANTLC